MAWRSLWSKTPTKFSNYFFETLFGCEWELTKSPAGAQQFKAKNHAADIPDAFDSSKRQVPTMLVTDLSLRVDPAYEKISRRFLEHPDQFADAFARAWFKLTHRDMGPRARYLGPEILGERATGASRSSRPIICQVDAKDIADLKAKILGSGLSIADLVGAAWASAATFRGSDKRGGANGARSSVPEDRAVNQPVQLAKVLETLAGVQKVLIAGAASGGKKASLADLDRLAVALRWSRAAKKAGQ